jgi:tetratricopeptide (TPR) repeat protein
MSEGRFASTIPGYLSIETKTDGGLLFDVVCEYTHRFLDAYVKRDAAALQSLTKKPEENGVLQNLMTIEFKQAIKAPPREWEIAEIIRRNQSVSEVRELVREAKTQNWKSPVIGEGLLNTLGYEFLFRGNTNLAIDTFQLAAEMYPSSANVYDSLSEAFDRAGKKDKAVELAEKALQLLESDPGITDQRREMIRTSASNRLKRLNPS